MNYTLFPRPMVLFAILILGGMAAYAQTPTTTVSADTNAPAPTAEDAKGTIEKTSAAAEDPAPAPATEPAQDMPEPSSESVSPSPAQEPPPAASPPPPAGFDWEPKGVQWWNHIEFGTRSYWIRYYDNKRPGYTPVGDSYIWDTFYGSINYLPEVQNYAPIHLFASVHFMRYMSVELSLESFANDTVTTAVPIIKPEPHNDGTMNMVGPAITFQLRYPTKWVTPYAGFGLVYLFNSFDADPAWANPAHNIALHQDFNMDNCVGWILAGGLTVHVARYVALDFYVRSLWAEVPGDHIHQIGDNGIPYVTASFKMPVDNFAMGIGLKVIL